MAALTTSTHETAYANAWLANGVTVVLFSGSGADDTTIAAAASGKQHWIIGGRISADQADKLDIYSGSSAAGTLLDQVQFVARGTLPLPAGVHTEAGEALVFDAGGTATFTGWVAYVTLSQGQYCPLIG